MKDIEKEIDDICEIMNPIVACLKTSIGNGVMNADTNEVGAVIDMVKDLAETKRDLLESNYYKTVTEAMEKSDEARMGYRPMMDQKPYVDKYISGSRNAEDYSEYGAPYNEYVDARRHYTETGSMSDKTKMDKHAKEHLDQTIETVTDIWNSASPELRQKMRTDLNRLMNNMS